MNCSRCRGTMVGSHVRGYGRGNGKVSASGLQCLSCGYVHDSVIEPNGLLRHERSLGFQSSEPDYQDEEVHLGVESFQWLAA